MLVTDGFLLLEKSVLVRSVTVSSPGGGPNWRGCVPRGGFFGYDAEPYKSSQGCKKRGMSVVKSPRNQSQVGIPMARQRKQEASGRGSMRKGE